MLALLVPLWTAACLAGLARALAVGAMLRSAIPRTPPHTLHWVFPVRQDLSNGGCGEGMPLQLNTWGALVKKHLLLG